MSYTERIKNFDAIRDYLRDFYVNGFHTRKDFDRTKSGRSYDDARRRIEDYLADYSDFHYGSDGKAVYVSIDSRSVRHNPLYTAFLMRSFTDRDIVLHFFILDVLGTGKALSAADILAGIEVRNSDPDKMKITEPTLRKKLKEYKELGIIGEIRSKGQVLYRLNDTAADAELLADAVDFFMEESPLGVIGRYVDDHLQPHESFLRFRNHYFMNACDSLILETILQGIHEEKAVLLHYAGRNRAPSVRKVVPLKLYINTIGGRSYLIGKELEQQGYATFRIDRVNKAALSDPVENYAEIEKNLAAYTAHLWGVSGNDQQKLEHFEMEIKVDAGESFIIDRLQREKRQGTLTRLENGHWLFSIDVYDTMEMVPWIRSYYGRIVRFSCSSQEVRQRLVRNIARMAEMYGDEDAVQ